MSKFSDLDYWKEEIPEEWHELLNTFCHACYFDIEFNKMPPVTLSCVQNKLNMLRIYYNGGDTRTDAYAHFAWLYSGKLKGDSC